MRAGARSAALVAGLQVLLAMAPSLAWAGEWRPWCGNEGSGPVLGWHFYCDRDDAPDEPPSQIPPEVAPSSAHARILEMRRELEEARATAVLDPSPAHVSAYLRLQQAALQKSAAFSDSFRRTVWATPALDYTLRRPVGALAKQVWSDGRREARNAALARLAERYGLIYLGDPACAACRVAGPLLRAFALRHGLDVLAVSTTGEALEGWPEAVPDHGRAPTAWPRRHAAASHRAVRYGDGEGPARGFRRPGRGPARRADIRAHRTGGRP